MTDNRSCLRPRLVGALSFIFALAPTPALAHSFGQVYNLPVPVWMYLYGAAAALALSFLVVAFVVSARPRGDAGRVVNISNSGVGRLTRQTLPGLQALSFAVLVLCIATGLWGTRNPYGNFNMTFFWVVFVLGFAYLTALLGNVYAAINPWRVLARSIGRLFHGYGQGWLRYPPGLSQWPALLLYMAFIWIELFGGTTPYSLAWLLLGYTALNLMGVGLVGVRAWFTHCEFFSVFFRLIAAMAPLRYTRSENSGFQVGLRLPFAGLLTERVASLSLLLFILFMLSSTAFDGLRETEVWRRLYWVDLYHAGLQDWFGRNPFAAFPRMNYWYNYWQGLWLLLSPFLYLAVYWLFVWLSKLAAGGRLSVRELALRYAPTLLPIALVYNITHYYTLIQTQGVKIISLASDPFSWGWDLFGTADWLQRTIIPDAVFVWHVQVGLIVLGHVISVYLAHLVALQIFESHRRALLSQLPMLVLMVIFTTVGLWILAQPISGG